MKSSMHCMSMICLTLGILLTPLSGADQQSVPGPSIAFGYAILPPSGPQSSQVLHLAWTVTPPAPTSSAALDATVLYADATVHQLPHMQISSCTANGLSCIFARDIALSGSGSALNPDASMASLQLSFSTGGAIAVNLVDLTSVLGEIDRLNKFAQEADQVTQLTAQVSQLTTTVAQLRSAAQSSKPTVFWDAVLRVSDSLITATSTCAARVHAEAMADAGVTKGQDVQLKVAEKTVVPSPALQPGTKYTFKLVEQGTCGGTAVAFSPASLNGTTASEAYIRDLTASNIQNSFIKLSLNARNVDKFSLSVLQLGFGTTKDILKALEQPAPEGCRGASLGDCQVIVPMPQGKNFSQGNQYRVVVEPLAANQPSNASNAQQQDFKGLSELLVTSLMLTYTAGQTGGLLLQPTLADNISMTMVVSVGGADKTVNYDPLSRPPEKPLSWTVPFSWFIAPTGAPESPGAATTAAAPKAGGGAAAAKATATALTIKFTANDGSGRSQTIPISIGVDQQSQSKNKKVTGFASALASVSSPTGAPTSDAKISVKDLAENGLLLLLKTVL